MNARLLWCEEEAQSEEASQAWSIGMEWKIHSQVFQSVYCPVCIKLTFLSGENVANIAAMLTKSVTSWQLGKHCPGCCLFDQVCKTLRHDQPFWHTLQMLVYVMINVRPASQPASQSVICGKSFNIVIFSDIINIINVKLCMMVVLIELCPLIVFQGHSSVKQLSLYDCWLHQIDH